MHSGRGAVLAALLLACGTIALFAPAVGFDFVAFDDPSYVSENPHVAGGLTPQSLRWAFVANVAANWHPLTWVSHLTDVTLFGLDPAGHHLTSILLHAASTALLFLVLRELTGALLPSLFAAALFAAHPLRVESVVWISERKDVLSVFFGVLTLGLYTINARRPSWKLRGLTLLCYAAGLMSKPLLVTLPAALVLLDYWPLARFNGNYPRRAFAAAVKEKLPLLALAVIASIVTWIAQSAGGAMLTTAEAPLPARLADVPAAAISYIGKTLAPINLSCFYPAHETPWPWWALAGACVTLGTMTLLVIRGRARRPHLLVGWLWFLGTLVPVIGLIRVGDHFIADRYTYLPHLGLFAAIAWEARDIVVRTRAPRLAAVAGVTLLTVLALLTRKQTEVWKDGLTLFEHADAVTIDNWLVKSYLGTVYLNSGRNRDAEWVFGRRSGSGRNSPRRTATSGWPCCARVASPKPLARRSRPCVCSRILRRRPTPSATPWPASAAGSKLPPLTPAPSRCAPTTLKPTSTSPARSDARTVTAKPSEHLLAAIGLNPGLSVAHLSLGTEYLALGRHAEALAAAREALSLDPGRAIIHFQLGLIYAAAGDVTGARREHELLLGMNTGLAARLRREIDKPPGR